MKITIKIECQSIGQFQQHLLSMLEQTIIYLHEEEKKGGLEAVDEFDPMFINSASGLDDSNCYGNRSVEMARIG